MLNPMETNKLLTLEEIDKLDQETGTDGGSYFMVRPSHFEALLATARAYHELVKESIEDEKRYVETLWQDKPHPATLKVIVEAMKEASVTVDGRLCHWIPSKFTQSLEKHLE